MLPNSQFQVQILKIRCTTNPWCLTDFDGKFQPTNVKRGCALFLVHCAKNLTVNWRRAKIADSCSEEDQNQLNEVQAAQDGTVKKKDATERSLRFRR
jgi:hypothetical protein